MSLDIYLHANRRCEVFTANITHNLGLMAKQAGLYEILWRPEELKINKAVEMIPILEKGLIYLKSEPDKFRQYNPENGWGSYEGLVSFCEKYLEACKENPDAEIHASR